MAPHLLPGERGLLFSSWNPRARQEWMIAVLEPGSDEIRFLLEGVGPLYARSGHLLYVDATQRILYAVPFDLDQLEVRGEPTIVARNVSRMAISDEGTLSYDTIRETPQRLVWLEPDGAREILALPEREYEMVRLSPDGRRAAVVIEEGTNSDVWAVDLERGTSTRLTPERFFAWDSYPVWSPEGDRVLFSSDRDGPPNIYRVSFHGGEIERLTNTRESVQYAHDITADGRRLVVTTQATEGISGRDADLALIDLETGTSEPLIASPAEERRGAISPDGRWLAYGSEESGEWQIYLQAFPGLGSRRHVTVDGFDGDPRWSPDGGTLYYARGEEIMAVAVRTDPEVEIGEPVSVAEIPELMGFDVAPDGRLLLIERIGPRRRGVVTVLNWSLALRGDR